MMGWPYPHDSKIILVLSSHASKMMMMPRLHPPTARNYTHWRKCRKNWEDKIVEGKRIEDRGGCWWWWPNTAPSLPLILSRSANTLR